MSDLTTVERTLGNLVREVKAMSNGPGGRFYDRLKTDVISAYSTAKELKYDLDRAAEEEEEGV